MKFNSLFNEEFKNDLLKAEFESGEKLGIVCLGESHLFFVKGLKTVSFHTKSFLVFSEGFT